MEISYRISEAEYLMAVKLWRKGAIRSSRIKSILFWVFIIVCLMLVFGIFQKSHQQPTIPEQPAGEIVGSGNIVGGIISNVAPLILFAGVWVFLIFKWMPMLQRRRYRKDPAMQGQFTVNITSESISTQNTAGTSSKTGWNIYDYWREGKDIILLVFHSGAYFLISLASLSEPQRDELRGLLATALPKK